MAAAFTDDPTIPDTAILWRRIPPGDVYLVFDESLNRSRPSSAAFQDSKDGSPMSVFIADDLDGPHDALAGHDGFYLVGFSAGVARECGLSVVRDPANDPPGHAFVVGAKTKSHCRKLARRCRWIVGPPDP